MESCETHFWIVFAFMVLFAVLAMIAAGGWVDAVRRFDDEQVKHKVTRRYLDKIIDRTPEA